MNTFQILLMKDYIQRQVRIICGNKLKPVSLVVDDYVYIPLKIKKDDEISFYFKDVLIFKTIPNPDEEPPFVGMISRVLDFDPSNDRLIPTMDYTKLDIRILTDRTFLELCQMKSRGVKMLEWKSDVKFVY